MVTREARRALFGLIADELRLGLHSEPGLDPGSRSELVGLVDDLVELAVGLDGDPALGDITPFDPIYQEVPE